NEVNICAKKLQSQIDSESTIKNTTTTTNITESCETFATSIILYLAGAVGKHADQLEAEYPRYDHSATA
ncbi:34369_t:CDS:2, partial [Racocetra persica]